VYYGRDMSKTRALGIVRLSKSADPASTSLTRQREIIESYVESQGMILVGWAEDPATSAFKIPPERRKQIKEWLDRPEEFDCLVYWRQDRLVRRARDFMGIVFWCQQHGKKLYSATEGLGDVTQHAGLLIGFTTAWQAEGESLNTSARVRSSQEKLAKEGRWAGGRLPYGFRSICVCHELARCPKGKDDCDGWKLIPDEKGTAITVREAARRVIAGESVNAVTADFNRRGVLSAEGKLWKALTLRRILRKPVHMRGILTSAEWSQLQSALDDRRRKQYVRTLDRDAITLDLIYCARCEAKVYRWHNKDTGRTYGRCRNELKRSEAAQPCHLPPVPYELLKEAVTADIQKHKDDLIETRFTDATRRLRIEAIEADLIELATELAARRIDRDEFTTRQIKLLDERDTLENASSFGEWRQTGERVGDRWERLSGAERRLWLLRIGAIWMVNCEISEDGKARRWIVRQWERQEDEDMRRERIVRPAA
jgi:DNA invertase Pin-like site-specific DNA recombinase